MSISHLDNGQDYPGFPVTVNQTYVIVQEGLLVDCTPYEFAVVSENSAGQSSAVSINDTIPICECVNSHKKQLNEAELVMYQKYVA